MSIETVVYILSVIVAFVAAHPLEFLIGAFVAFAVVMFRIH
jgi:hypothetical protein